MLVALAPQDAAACTFNCNKSPELRGSGFVTKTDKAAPFANSYKGERPALAIQNAGDATVIIWLHGQGNPRNKEYCSAQHNLPPRSILSLNERADTHVYYHCSAVTDPRMKADNTPDDGVHYKFGYAMGYYTLGRRDELEEVLNEFLEIGVKPSNIIISGHSAGGWTALLASASYPEKFGKLIAFAPAFAGPRNEENMYPWWRKIVRPEQIAMITSLDTASPDPVKKLVFAYEDDRFNRPVDLTFIEESFPDTTTLISQKCGKGHDTHKTDCKLDQTIALMQGFIFGQ